MNDSKVKHVNILGDKLKEDISDEVKPELETKLQAFNKRFEGVRQRLKDMTNKDLPEGSSCWLVRLMRRKLFRASIN